MTNWLQILISLMPAVEQALQIIINDTGETPDEAAKQLVDHLTPGKPNSPSLKP